MSIVPRAHTSYRIHSKDSVALRRNGPYRKVQRRRPMEATSSLLDYAERSNGAFGQTMPRHFVPNAKKYTKKAERSWSLNFSETVWIRTDCQSEQLTLASIHCVQDRRAHRWQSLAENAIATRWRGTGDDPIRYSTLARGAHRVSARTA